jgi:Arc/MetJ-type ribon-helix-helix transcriptional regulator
MKAVTIHLEESVYSDFQTLARKSKRSASELIREAMDLYRQKVKKNTHSLTDSPPAASVGDILEPWSKRSEMLDNFFDRE